MMLKSFDILAKRSCLAISLLVAGSVIPAFAYDENSPSQINVDATHVAMRGFDPVAYFTLGKPTKGKAQFQATHDGATYFFADAADREAFVKDPAKYVPAYGGFCAMGAAFEKKIDGDPQLWRIVDGKLYLNVSEAAQSRWLEDVPGNINKATKNWSVIKDKAPKDL